ncbi:MAG: 23S rRNA (guanosine(2251)-2'-O)-methyltransferase RlmB [Firmicutes bacterium]|nr:23S rRNA (guanosine(2251)-2'-O)-methyltransferase RlmB [Bacillota bacterium]
MKIEGRNAVMEALKSEQTVDRLVAQKDLKDSAAQRIIDEAKKRGVKIKFYDKEALDRESRTGRHQGFIAEITDFKYCELDDILSYAEKREEKPFIILLDGVEDPHNLGSVLRVAECAGAHGVVIPTHRSVSVNETVIKVSAGAAGHVRVHKAANISDTIETLKKRNIWVYCADLNGQSLYKTDLTGAVAIVVGGEGKGVGTRVKACCDGAVTIPMLGKVNSLNASVAAGVVAFEKVRQDNVRKP